MPTPRTVTKPLTYIVYTNMIIADSINIECYTGNCAPCFEPLYEHWWNFVTRSLISKQMKNVLCTRKQDSIIIVCTAIISIRYFIKIKKQSNYSNKISNNVRGTNQSWVKIWSN